MSLKSYGFAIGSLRVRENSLLRRTDLSHMIASENTEQLARLMYDKGIGHGADSNDIPDMLKSENGILWEYITDIAPDLSYFLPFYYENDFHNLKAVLKALLKGFDYKNLVITPSTVDTELIAKAIRDDRFDILPDFMSAVAKEAYEILTRTQDAQICDGIIDAACMRLQLECVNSLKSDVIGKIIKTTVFYNNIKIALRSAKAKKTSEFLSMALVEDGFIPKKQLINAALAGVDKVLELLSKVDAVSGSQAAELYQNAPWRLEKFADELILKIALDCRSITMGIEPVVAYMIIKLNEIKNLRIIYSGVKTGQSINITEERLRDVNG